MKRISIRKVKIWGTSRLWFSSIYPKWPNIFLMMPSGRNNSKYRHYVKCLLCTWGIMVILLIPDILSFQKFYTDFHNKRHSLFRSIFIDIFFSVTPVLEKENPAFWIPLNPTKCANNRTCTKQIDDPYVLSSFPLRLLFVMGDYTNLHTYSTEFDMYRLTTKTCLPSFWYLRK